MFWNGEQLKKHLDTLIVDEHGHSAGTPDNVDCAAYALTIGPELFITPVKDHSEDDKGHTKVALAKNESFVIPKGQFAFLLSEEFVRIPDTALGLLSFKTKHLKFKGLVNVSGFHVDPGFYGRIIFSLFNAGPLDITLQRGQQFALLWLADLNQKTELGYPRTLKL